MFKAIKLLGIVQELSSLAEKMPGVRIATLTDTDYSMLKISKPDGIELVIFDLSNAAGEGMKELHNAKSAFNTPFVIVITNLNNDDFRNRCYSLGADLFVDKRGDLKELQNIFRNLLGTKVKPVSTGNGHV